MAWDIDKLHNFADGMQCRLQLLVTGKYRPVMLLTELPGYGPPGKEHRESAAAFVKNLYKPELSPANITCYQRSLQDTFGKARFDEDGKEKPVKVARDAEETKQYVRTAIRPEKLGPLPDLTPPRAAQLEGKEVSPRLRERFAAEVDSGKRPEPPERDVPAVKGPFSDLTQSAEGKRLVKEQQIPQGIIIKPKM